MSKDDIGPQEHAATPAVYTEATYNAKKEAENKPAVKYIPPMVLLAMGHVFAFGAKKHAPFGWREANLPYMELYGKALRHMLQWATGSDEDVETKSCHITNAMCDLAMLLDLIQQGKGKDDR